MTKTTKPEQIEDADLDQAAGGYDLKNVMVTSYQTSSDAADERRGSGVKITFDRPSD